MLLHELLLRSAELRPEHPAVVHRGVSRSYREVAEAVRHLARGLFALDLAAHDRIGVFLDKQFETVESILGISMAGFTFVPINPALRGAQAAYIMQNCNVRVLITTSSRLSALEEVLDSCPDLERIVIVDRAVSLTRANGQIVESYAELMARGKAAPDGSHAVQPADMAGILYTSGSTGNPKGVVFSHRNFVTGAQSVSTYLRYRPEERVINIPPYSFDFGLNQLFSSLCAGCTAVLHNFLSVQELMRAIAAGKVTGVSGVPTVMIQLAAQSWPEELAAQVRYMSTTGGRMPEPSVHALRRSLPRTDLYLMYGLTEAFRATFLPPEEVDRRPNSIGKAIPGAEVLVVRPDGTICDPDEPGELVQKGELVTLGYWNDPVRTAERFKPAPGISGDDPNPELAVYSGDTVTRDAEGFIYYIGRQDEMIKTSGYRVSPTEIEAAVFATNLVSVAAAVGIEDDLLGQTVIIFATPHPGQPLDAPAILEACRQSLPAYMVPRQIIERDAMPLNPNGKVDRKRLASDYAEEGLATPEPVNRVEADETAGATSFLGIWRQELSDLLSLRQRDFRTVLDLFRWAFPDRAVSADDSFLSLDGDSLSYVSISTGLDDILDAVPDDWAEQPITALEKLKRNSSTVVVPVRNEILLRVVGMFGVLLNHTGGIWLTLGGSAKLLMVISGLSFARFIWCDNPRRILTSTLRFAGNILVPTIVFLMIAFIVLGYIDWPVLLFYDNLVSPNVPPWWVSAWYIQNLLQFMLFMVVLAFIPGFTRFSIRHKYIFAILLTIGGVAAHVGSRAWVSPAGREFNVMPQDYFWLFAFGWLAAVSETKAQKMGAFAILALSVGTVLAANRVDLFPMYADAFGYWLLIGVAILFSNWFLSVPRSVNHILVLLARSMLFVYLLHWPISQALIYFWSLGDSPKITIGLGFLGALAIWIIWETLSRTISLYWAGRRGVASAGGELAIVS